MIENKSERTKKIELINLANMNEKEVKKADYKLKQKHYAAKNKLGKVIWDSSTKGTYIKQNKELEVKYEKRKN